MERIHKGTRKKAFPKEYVCVDIETTGVFPEHDRIIEVSAFHVKNKDIIDKYTSLVKLPGKKRISKQVEDITGITNNMLEDAPDEMVVMSQFYQFIGDNLLLGHNVEFDINFLYDACERYGLLLNNNFVDTLQLSRDILPELKKRKLSDLAEHLNVEQATTHRAEADVLTTCLCYERMRDKTLRFDRPDEIWSELSLKAIKEAKLYGVHTWELSTLKKEKQTNGHD